MDRTIALAMTGASGAQYGLRLLECLLRAECSVQLMLSRPARLVISMETELKLPARAADTRRFLLEHFEADAHRLQVYGLDEWTAPVASGSNASAAMVICPCTTGTLAAVSAGVSRSLIERAADVALKERRRLIVVVRETPFSALHLENMLRLARAGAVIMPANPGFYHRPDSVDDLVDFVVARIMDHLGVAHSLLPRWGADSADGRESG